MNKRLAKLECAEIERIDAALVGKRKMTSDEAHFCRLRPHLYRKVSNGFVKRNEVQRTVLMELLVICSTIDPLSSYSSMAKHLQNHSISKRFLPERGRLDLVLRKLKIIVDVIPSDTDPILKLNGKVLTGNVFIPFKFGFVQKVSSDEKEAILRTSTELYLYQHAITNSTNENSLHVGDKVCILRISRSPTA